MLDIKYCGQGQWPKSPKQLLPIIKKKTYKKNMNEIGRIVFEISRFILYITI